MSLLKTLVTLVILLQYNLYATEIDQKRWYWEAFNVVYTSFRQTNTSPIKNSEGYNKNISGQISAILPIVMKKKFVCATGIDYEIWNINIDGVSLYGIPKKNEITASEYLENRYQRIYLLTGFSWIFSKYLNIYTETDIGLTSTLKDVDKSDINFQSTIYTSYTFSESGVQVIGGIALDYDFGEPVMMPVLGLHWGITEHAAIDILVPIQASVKFRIGDHIETGGKFRVISREFRMDNQLFMADESISIRRYELYPFLDYRLKHGIFLRATGGLSLGSTEIRKSDHTSIAELKNGAGYFGEISFRIGI